MAPKGEEPRRLTVVTLVDGIGPGGGERLAAEVARRLDPDRYVRILCASRWDDEEPGDPALKARETLVGAGVRFLGLRRSSAAALWAWRPLVSLIRSEPVDIVHAHKFGSNLWASLLRPIARPPVVVAHEHTWSYEGKPLRKLADRYAIAPRVDAFVAVSRADRRRMVEIERISESKVRFIPNGIEALPEPTGDVRAELGIGAGDPVIGAVGSLRAQKGYDILIRAAALMVGEFARLRILIAGEGEEREALSGLIAELGLDRVVTLLGYRPDIPALLAALDVAVVASRFEGSPLAVLEYMDAGRPVVATRVGGIPDLITDGVHGVLVEPNDPSALAAGISELLRNPERAGAMGARGRERRRSEFDIANTVREIQALYEELWRARRAGQARA